MSVWSDSAMNRVTPSAISSIIASACSTPDCGLACAWLSILTAITRRSIRVSSSTYNPFSGDWTPAGKVVVVLAVVDVDVVDGEAGAVVAVVPPRSVGEATFVTGWDVSPDPAQAAVTNVSASTNAARRS